MPTSIDTLFVLAGIISSELRRNKELVSLARRTVTRAPSPRPTPVHTNFATARTQIEEPLCLLRWNYWKIEIISNTIAVQLSGRIISEIRNGRKIVLAFTHLFLLLAPHTRNDPT